MQPVLVGFRPAHMEIVRPGRIETGQPMPVAAMGHVEHRVAVSVGLRGDIVGCGGLMAVGNFCYGWMYIDEILRLHYPKFLIRTMRWVIDHRGDRMVHIDVNPEHEVAITTAERLGFAPVTLTFISGFRGYQL